MLVGHLGWQLASQRISRLRSPVVHHPHPSPFAPLRSLDRDTELIRPDGFHLPSAASLDRFCTTPLQDCRVARSVVRSSAVGLRFVDGGTEVALASGAVVRSRRVVVATNPRRPVVPVWAGEVPPNRLQVTR
ncbi:hypothetical protein [Euzebya pacifica]|uniref:hypothetical protein n=1 Tax=Euzebya pacifica TaxID=1608957 RepID=UPI0030FB7D6E